ncbi:MAG TPA: DUF1992 domain-containing protein [Methylomirabilota bacterium]|nr:DUF1992 domain-containing protein [Methylomirabilota bacterium]
MPPRKPLGKSYREWVEELIQEAQQAGEFDRLDGAGRPIPGIEAPYDPDWWVKKLLEREKLSVLPPALDLLRKVEAGLEEVWKARGEEEARARVNALNAEIARVNSRIAEGPATRLAALEVDAVVSEWRARRASI